MFNGIIGFHFLCNFIPSTFIKIKNHLNFFGIYFFFGYIGTLHLFPQIYSNFPLYKMKWNSFFTNLLPRLYFNIICKSIVKFFQKFEVRYTQTCMPLESSTIWHPKGIIVVCFHPFWLLLLSCGGGQTFFIFYVPNITMKHSLLSKFPFFINDDFPFVKKLIEIKGKFITQVLT
jgi:hypothetical protein